MTRKPQEPEPPAVYVRMQRFGDPYFSATGLRGWLDREWPGWTLRKVARIGAVPRSTLAAWLSGRQPDLDVLLRFAALIGVDLREVFPALTADGADPDVGIVWRIPALLADGSPGRPRTR